MGWQFTEAGLERDLELLKVDTQLLQGKFSIRMKSLEMDKGAVSEMGKKIIPETLANKMAHRITVHVNGGPAFVLDLGEQQRE